MIRPRLDFAWSLLSLAVAEVLNPLLLISSALFVSVGYILTLLMPVSIVEWRILYGFAVAVPLCGLVARSHLRYKHGLYQNIHFTARALLPLLPLLIFVPMFLTELSTPILQIRHHGDLHIGYVHNLLYRITPIENIFVAGYPANYYWLYHAFLAVLVSFTSLAPPFVGSIVNIVVIMSSLYWLAQILIALKLADRRSVRLGCYVVLVYCAVNLTGAMTLLSTILDGTFESGSLRIMLLPGADRRLHSVMGKVMNFTSMSIGIWSFLVTLYYCLRYMQGKIDRTSLVMFAAAVIVCLAVRQTGALFILVALLGGTMLSAFVSFVSSKPDFNSARSWIVDVANTLGLRFLILCGVASACLALALVDYFRVFSSGINAPIRVELFNSSNLAMIAAALWLFFPLWMLQSLFALRSQSWGERFIQIAGAIGFSIAWVTVLPDDGQYKTVYYLSILFALSGLLALNKLSLSLSKIVRRLSRIAIAALVILAYAKVAFVKAHYDDLASGWSINYEQSHIDIHEGSVDSRYMESLRWIRSNTPVDGIVILPLNVHRYTHLAHERQLYVKQSQYLFTGGITAYDERVRHLSQIYNGALNIEDYEAALEEMMSQLPGRPLYAVVMDPEVSREIMAGRGAQLVFEKPPYGAHVYLLNPPAAG